MILENIKPIVLDFGKSGSVTLVPVKHGWWKRMIMEDKWYKTKSAVFMCSRCRHTQISISKYCGGCGALMDGGKNGKKEDDN